MIERLETALKAAGLTLTGIAILRPDRQAEPGWVVLTGPNGQRVRLDGMKGNAAAAQAVIDAFDFRERTPKAAAVLLTEVQALAQADRNKLLAAMAADWLQTNPGAARKLGIALDGDQPL